MLNGFFFNTPIDNHFLGHIVAEVFKDKVYEPYLSGKKDLTILDFGGNIGVTAYYFSQFAKEVHVFEPAEEHFEVLQFMINFNKLSNIIPHKVALSNSDGEETFYHLDNKTMFSLRPAAIDPTLKHEKVKTKRLDTFFKENNIQHVDFMKLDIEGSEADVLCGDGFANVADKIDMIFIELHSWMGRNVNQMKDALKINGFKNITVIPNEAVLWLATK